MLQEAFDHLNDLILPKPALCHRLITAYAKDVTIVGFPVCIESHKYKRNKLLFNFGFAFSASTYTDQFEPVCRKIAKYLRELELRNEFLSNTETKNLLPRFMVKLREGLLTTGQCSFQINEWCLIYVHLSVTLPEPPNVWDFYVPVLIGNGHHTTEQEVDGTLKRVLRYIDGTNHVSAIAHKATVDTALVRKCIQHLVYYQVCVLVDIFQYSNVYIPTPLLNSLYNDGQLQEDCSRYISKSEAELVPASAYFLLYTKLSAKKNISSFCEENAKLLTDVIVERLIQFGLVFGLLRRLRRWPVLLQPDGIQEKDSESVSTLPRQLTRMFNGTMSFDEICYRLKISCFQLEELVANDPNIAVVWK
eukprot:CFRG4451T1